MKVALVGAAVLAAAPPRGPISSKESRFLTPGLSKGFKPLFKRRESEQHLPVANARLYRRTEAGKAAWQRQDAGVPVEYRRVLGLIDTDTHPDSLRTRLARSEADTLHLLEELVERGLLEAVQASAQHDLDFTGNFNLTDLRKAGL